MKHLFFLETEALPKSTQDVGLPSLMKLQQRSVAAKLPQRIAERVSKAYGPHHRRDVDAGEEEGTDAAPP